MTAEDVSRVKENRSAVIDHRYNSFSRTGAREFQSIGSTSTEDLFQDLLCRLRIPDAKQFC
jgi:hypothetical protein